MAMLALYSSTVPVLACNLLFYSITSLSTSITSTKNVIQFILACKECDSILLKKEMDLYDIKCKLTVTQSLIEDILSRHCTSEELQSLKLTNWTNVITEYIDPEDDDFLLIDCKPAMQNISNIPIPLQYAIAFTSEIIQRIHTVMHTAYQKIQEYNASYLKKISGLHLCDEIRHMEMLSGRLDMRIQTLYSLLAIYPIKAM